MYSDVGKKIMGLAQVCGWICVICSAIIWLVNMADGDQYNNTAGWIWLAFGVLSFISSWAVYGFGQLVDDVHAMRNQIAEPEIAEDDELPEL